MNFKLKLDKNINIPGIFCKKPDKQEKGFMKTMMQVYQNIKIGIEKWLLRRRLRKIMKVDILNLIISISISFKFQRDLFPSTGHR